MSSTDLKCFVGETQLGIVDKRREFPSFNAFLPRISKGVVISRKFVKRDLREITTDATQIPEDDPLPCPVPKRGSKTVPW